MLVEPLQQRRARHVVSTDFGGIAEHVCLNANRYQKSDGSEGGCHEWDYETNLQIQNGGIRHRMY